MEVIDFVVYVHIYTNCTQIKNCDVQTPDNHQDSIYSGHLSEYINCLA
jgi:hypothetical protein